MIYIKRLLTITICFFIMLASAFYSYIRIDSRCLVYADSTTDNWQNVTTNAELVEAFRYYCKSRDLTIDGSIADGVTQFTTKTFNGLCNSLGIDVTALQAHLKYETDDNNGLRFLFDTSGISAYNRIFAQFLQDNNLEVGDSADQANNTVYSGYIYTDADGNNTLVWMVSSTSVNSNSNVPNQYILARGSYYKYTQDTLMALVPNAGSTTTTFHLTSSKTFTGRVRHSYTDNSTAIYDNYDFYQDGSTVNSKYIGGYRLIKSSGKRTTYSGYPCIFYSTDTNKFYMGVYGLIQYSDNSPSLEGIGNLMQFNVTNSNYQNTTVYLTTNNTVINNNTYEGDTIINNNGTPTDPNAPDPDDPTSDPSDWGVELPDLDIPWFLRGKEDKFPWDIPYSMILLLSVLNAEPEAPHIEGTLDLGVYEWNYELNLEDFDDVATICRNMQFIAFLIGLMLLTKKLIWG